MLRTGRRFGNTIFLPGRRQTPCLHRLSGTRMPACSTLGNSRVTPHPPPADTPAPRTRKPGSPSVVLQLGAWIAAIAGLAVVSILASITVAELSSGEARAINLAGSLRMQSYVIRAAAGPARRPARPWPASCSWPFRTRPTTPYAWPMKRSARCGSGASGRQPCKHGPTGRTARRCRSRPWKW